MAYEDTLRLLLQNKFDRIENLAQIKNQATLAIPSILATIWGIDGGLNGFHSARILCIISIGLLLIWRYFAHYIDNDIAKTYVDIVKIEDKLGVPPYLSLYESIVDSLTKNKNCVKDNQQFTLLNRKLKELCPNDKIRLFGCLYEKRKMGSRGHYTWDVLAFCIVLICFSTMILGLQFIYNWIGFFILFVFFVLIMCALGNIWLMAGGTLILSLFFIPFIIPVFISIGIGMGFCIIANDIIQKEPSLQDILEILMNLKNL